MCDIRADEKNEGTNKTFEYRLQHGKLRPLIDQALMFDVFAPSSLPSPVEGEGAAKFGQLPAISIDRSNFRHRILVVDHPCYRRFTRAEGQVSMRKPCKVMGR
jgi:hypothetical protein